MTVKRVVPNLPSADPNVGHDFYVNVLGLDVAMDMGWIVTFVSKDEPTAQLSVVKLDPSTPHPDYSVEVSDVDKCHRRASAAGCEIVYPLVSEPWGVRRFFVRDPNGKIANIMSH